MKSLYLQHKIGIMDNYVVFLGSDLADQVQVSARISEIIKDNWDLNMPAFSVSEAEMKFILENNPYSPGEGEELKFHHVTLLEKLPEKDLIHAISQYCNENEQFSWQGRILWLYYPGG